MRILAVGAHPDDMEFYCGGTVAKCTERGDEIYVAVVTGGGRGSDLSEVETVSIRRAEAEAAAEIVGAKLIWLGLRDAALFYTEDNRALLVEAVREASPDVMLIPSPNDYHPDHRATSQLALEASGMAKLPMDGSRHARISHTPAVYYVDTCFGIGFDPELYVDITDVFETKKKMVECHVSQAGHPADHWGRNLVDYMEIQTSFRGLQCGARYAEGFIKYHAGLRSDTERLLP